MPPTKRGSKTLRERALTHAEKLAACWMTYNLGIHVTSAQRWIALGFEAGYRQAQRDMRKAEKHGN